MILVLSLPSWVLADANVGVPNLNGCFLAVDETERIVFTTCLLSGWRPAEEPFITAIIRFAEHPLGTEYVAHVMHKSNADRNNHAELGFYDE